MGTIEADAFDFIERCRDHATAAAILGDFMAMVRPYGFDHLIMTGVPVNGQNLAPLVELNGWPLGWLERYVEKEYTATDGVCLYAARTTKPFFWSDMPGPFLNSAGTKLVSGEASEFGIRSGLVVPAHSPLHWQSAVSLASGARRCDISKREELTVALMAVSAIGAVEALRSPEVSSEPILSSREREVLSWTASGKTGWEVSRILSIAEKTVERHMTNIRIKLNASNSAQAVASALLRREISPADLSIRDFPD